MATRIWLSKIEFNDGSKISINKNDIVVFVGPNNAGKSASLKEAAMLIRLKQNKTKTLKDVTIEKEGDESEMISFLDSFSKKEIMNNQLQYKGYKFNISEAYAKSCWVNYKDGIFDLGSVFINAMTTEERLTAVNSPQSIKITSEAPQHPIHFLQKFDSLEKKFSGYFKQAFGTDLIVHRSAGNEVPLYIGNKPIPQEGDDRVSEDYLNKLEKLDLLQEQGDGMRSFVGVLLNAFISQHSVLFIDEPEAFLHPPQARLLGKMLAKDLPSERQVFLATHSEDFLKGLLDANVNNLKIIRIQREDKINKVSVLNNNDINSIWNDSLLRHSNILNGLFHSKVIICESDSDCRFFSAILSSLFDSNTLSPDVLFIHCGGKHRMPTVVKSLKKLNVPLRVVSDFDVLNDINPLKDIFEDLGGTWTDVEADWKLVKSEIEKKRPELSTEELKTKINDVFKTIEEKIIPKNKIIEIQKTLKKASPWSAAKEVGKAFIPSGNATQAFERIQIQFKAKGLFILEVGELESFVKSAGNHGPKWVSDVLTKDLINDTELKSAKQFVSLLIK